MKKIKAYSAKSLKDGDILKTGECKKRFIKT